MSDQGHPYAGYPAALILADHKAILRDPPARPTRCDCGWTGPSCDHPAHVGEVLHRAGLLADGPPPVTRPYVSGSGVCGCIARIADITVTGIVDWPQDRIREAERSALRLAGQPSLVTFHRPKLAFGVRSARSDRPGAQGSGR